MKTRIKQFYNWTISEIKRREKYIDKQNDKWQTSIKGSKYKFETDVLSDIQEKMYESVEYDLKIEIKERKY